MLDILLKSFWFEDVNNLKVNCIADQYKENKMIEYIREFQNGNFQPKKEFLDYFLFSTDRRVFVIGMRLFMAISDHTDFKLLEEFLSVCEEEKLRVFLAYVQEAMSLHAIPYLLALYEDWENTNVEKDIARCICGMLGQKYYAEEDYDVEQLGEMFVDFAGKHDMNRFYFDGEEYFSGNLTKTIIGVVFDCYNKNRLFYTDQIPSILSNGSGIKCPVSNGVAINESKIKEIYDYVNELSLMKQRKGEKYFYNFKVN